MPIYNTVITLNANEVYAALSNMIISQEVFADNIADGYESLVDRARVDGGLHGDTKLFISTDILRSYQWTGDNEAANLLNIHRAPDPVTQGIVLNVFRQIPITVDYYLSKRAWIDEFAFSSFTSVLLGWLRETKRVYDQTLYNTFIGTHKATNPSGKQTLQIDINDDLVASYDASTATTAEQEAMNRLNAQNIATKIADLFIQLRKPSRDYNDLEFMRSYKRSDLVVVWNSKWVNEIMKLDLPSIFHSEEVVKDLFKEENILPPEYFGNLAISGGTADGSTHRSTGEYDFTVGGVTTHVFAGELIPAGATYNKEQCYIADALNICKIMHRRSVPLMSAFEVGTSFFNAKSLTENHYLTWGHNTLEHLANYPFITVASSQ